MYKLYLRQTIADPHLLMLGPLNEDSKEWIESHRRTIDMAFGKILTTGKLTASHIREVAAQLQKELVTVSITPQIEVRDPGPIRVLNI